LAAVGLGGCGAAASILDVGEEIVLAQAQDAGAWVEIAGGRYTTEFDEGMKERSHNLRLACEVVDGVILKVGEEFSFNKHVGLATAEKGYLPAKIFINGKEAMGLGGGICQLSSTLYNAAEGAGMTVLERHAHSRRVYYVPVGRDAATAYGGVDLRFRNDLPYVVRLRASAVDGKNVVWLERM